MYARLILFGCFLLINKLAGAQKTDSVRLVVNQMGYNLPRLSPIPVSNNPECILSLNGTWLFRNGLDDTDKAEPKSIEVPGQWVMQGFKIAPGSYASYTKKFEVPGSWKDRRIKLRCDAVYSECEIFINGRKAGGHLGGFTPFETDITSFLLKGKPNTILIKVRSESIADSLASGTRYAVHPLGGITRKIYLLCLPVINCSMFHVSTTFDNSYSDALLTAEVELANESEKDADAELVFELIKDREDKPVFVERRKINGPVKANSLLLNKFSFNIRKPEKWDPEHPNLYSLRLSLFSDGKIIEVTERVFGFKQTEIRGNQVFVNNRPVKLRGVCRHEAMPLRGRSLSPGQWEEDIRIFRDANINYIRTSHYPPAPELLEACDRLGMFVEVEGPFCWAHETKVPESRRYEALIQPELEMVNAFRSHPSVLMWSLANESGNYDYFTLAARLIKAIDPTRPRNFSQWGPGADNNELEIDNHHYPGPDGPAKYNNHKRPIVFDEYCHLNAYNRFELVTDPGIRDAWGLGFERMWEKMYYSGGVLGGALWAAIDDSFFLPDGKAVGYGTWGPVDGWRRPKPEYWHVKKVYSPVKIKQRGIRDNASGILELEIENRMQFSDLSECRFFWKAGEQKGSFTGKAMPGETVTIPVKVPAAEKLYVEVADPRGVMIDQYEFTLSPESKNTESKNTENKTQRILKAENETEISFTSGGITLIIDKSSGLLKEFRSEGSTIIKGDAKLMILPLNGEGKGTQMTGDNTDIQAFTQVCRNRVIQRTETSSGDGKLVHRIYDITDEARGYTEYIICDGVLQVSYKYELLKEINPRQTGLVFYFQNNFNRLEWELYGQWNYYPDDHIGRLKGQADASSGNPLSGPAGPSAKPLQAWAFDQNIYGTNDFRSTKMNIVHASLSDAFTSVNVVSDGSQSIRCWKEDQKTKLLIASYSNMGAERFFRGHAQLMDKPLKPGDQLMGSITLTFTDKTE